MEFDMGSHKRSRLTNQYAKFWKRMIDVLVAVAVLIVLSVPMVILMVVIKLTSRGPIFFTQQRYGLNGQIFKILKFRTMYLGTPLKANSEFNDMDAYLTSVGKVMRELSLDELPQLLNVIKGDMSLIGPRPLADSDYHVIEMRAKNGADRVRPGITGLAQINGRNEITDIEKAGYDGMYASQVTLLGDVAILLKTIKVAVSREGINKTHLK